MAQLTVLSGKSAKIMEKILAMLPDEDFPSVKLNNAPDVYMPLCVEKGVLDIDDVLDAMTSVEEKFAVSLAHYGEQLGDLMRDPEVVFLCWKNKEGRWQYAPATFRNDYVGVDERDIFVEKGKIRFHQMSQEGLVEFCDDWMMNIADQQEIEI